MKVLTSFPTQKQQLRENLITESDLSLVAISDMLDVLKPMQAAKFLVKAHFVHTAVMQLQMIWEALKVRLNPLSCLCF